MKYRKRAPTDAFQLTASVRDDVEAWPAWLQTAWDKPLGTVGAMWRGYGTDLMLGTLAGATAIPHNGWVIRGAKRQLSSLTAEAFDEIYVAVEE